VIPCMVQMKMGLCKGDGKMKSMVEYVEIVSREWKWNLCRGWAPWR